MPKIGGCYEVPIKNSASRTLVTLSFTVHAQGVETEMKLLYETVQSNTHSCAINATIVKLLVVAFLKSRLCFDLKLWPQIRGPDQIWGMIRRSCILQYISKVLSHLSKVVAQVQAGDGHFLISWYQPGDFSVNTLL